MRFFLYGLLAVIAVVAGFLFFWPVNIEPVAWDPGPNRGLTGVLAREETLKFTPLEVGGEGPEAVAVGIDGMLYTGLLDGRIVTLPPDGSAKPVVFANTGGRPLGMKFDAAGNLIVADAFKGLLSVAPDGAIRVLTDSVAGKKMIFVDDLDIASDGTIWFSDASQRFDLHQNVLDFYEGQATGRLLSYNPATGETKSHVENLAFANGVALGPNDEYVLVNETMRYRTKRLWLTGAKAGQVDTFIEHLPAFVDNITFDGTDTFWIAMVLPRSQELDDMAPQPMIRAMLVRVVQTFGLALPTPPPQAWTIAVNTKGEITQSLRTTSGAYANVTSAMRVGDTVYLGSLTAPSIAKVQAP